MTAVDFFADFVSVTFVAGAETGCAGLADTTAAAAGEVAAFAADEAFFLLPARPFFLLLFIARKGKK